MQRCKSQNTAHQEEGKQKIRADTDQFVHKNGLCQVSFDVLILGWIPYFREQEIEFEQRGIL
jgi:hypothetical protein